MNMEDDLEELYALHLNSTADKRLDTQNKNNKRSKFKNAEFHIVTNELY